MYSQDNYQDFALAMSSILAATTSAANKVIYIAENRKNFFLKNSSIWGPEGVFFLCLVNSCNVMTALLFDYLMYFVMLFNVFEVLLFRKTRTPEKVLVLQKVLVLMCVFYGMSSLCILYTYTHTHTHIVRF